VTTTADRAAARAAARAYRTLAADLERACADAGVTPRELAAASGVDSGFLSRILGGKVRPSLDTYARLAVPMGLDLSARLYPNTGPTIRDRHQGRMLELLLLDLHPRWHSFLEVEVRRPSRGWIDAALHDPREAVLVASELQSELRRLEQLIRWQAAKADALPSWAGWALLGQEPRISRLLVVRRTRSTRTVAAECAAQLRTAYPAHPDDALAALAGMQPWPGAALIWAEVDSAGARFVQGR
jgi:transcriptional regulator with XRE-family HTH domain